MGFRDGALNLKSADGPRPYSSPIPAQFSKPPSPLEQSPSTRKPGLMQRTTHALRRTTSASRPTTQIPTQPRTRPVHRTAFSRLAGRIPLRSVEIATVTVDMRRKPVENKPNQSPLVRQQNRPRASETMERPPHLAVRPLGGHARILPLCAQCPHPSRRREAAFRQQNSIPKWRHPKSGSRQSEILISRVLTVT